MRETPQFPSEFTGYLEQNGWQKEEVSAGWISFRRHDMRVIVKGETIDILIQMDESGRRPLQLMCSFTGWPMLNDFTFMLLMHAMNVVSLKQFVRKAKKVFSQEAMKIDSLLQHFKVELLPEAY